MTAAARSWFGTERAGALAHHLRPWRKRLRANDITVEAEPFAVGGRPRVVARIPRSKDVGADHALADLVVASIEIAESFASCCATARARPTASSLTCPLPASEPTRSPGFSSCSRAPPPVLGRCLVCKVRVGHDA